MYKIPAAGGPPNIHPHPPLLKDALWPDMLEGGVYQHRTSRCTNICMQQPLALPMLKWI